MKQYSEQLEHWATFWDRSDFANILDMDELAEAQTPEQLQRIGMKLRDAYLLDLEESGIE